MNSFGSSPSPFGQSLFGGPSGQQPQQQSNPFMGGQGFGGGFQPQQQSNPFMSTQGGYGGFGAGMQNGYGGGQGYGGGSNYQMPAYAQSYMGNMGTGYGGYNGQMQGNYGGYNGQMQGNYGGQGGYGRQMQNPFMGGQGFGGGYGRDRGFGGGYGGQMQGSMGQQYASPQMQNAAMNQPLRQQYDTMMAQSQFMPGTAPPTFEEYSQRQAARQQQFPAFAQSYMGNMGNMGNMALQQQQQAQQAQQAQQQRAFSQDPEFQGYRQQQEDLSRQMNEYMQKAPMYQQLQDLQGKMQGVQGRYASNPYAGSMGPGAPIQARQAEDDAMRRALDDSGMGRQAQLAGMPRNPMQQLGGVGGLTALLGGQPQVQPAQPAIPQPQVQERPTPFPKQGDWDPERRVLRSTGAPPGMEMRKGMGGSYYVPTGTPYNPAMG